MRSGSHERSLPALQRLCPPGMRPLLASACAHSRQGCLSRAFLRSGASSFTSCFRIAIVNDEVTPTCCSVPLSSYRPSSREPTASFPVLAKHARTADRVVAGFRWHKTGKDAAGSLPPGRYDDSGTLQHGGVTSSCTLGIRTHL